MAVTKKEAFTPEAQQLADWCKALGHPARIAILLELARRNACVCGEIVEVLPLAQATVSQHLKALKDAGLVQGTVEGKNTCYCINPEVFAAFQAALTPFMQTCCTPAETVGTPKDASCC